MCRQIIGVFMLFLLAGCFQNPSIDKLDKQKANELSIVNTVKAELSNGNSKAIILSTYLNPFKVLQIDNEKENFLVSIYINKKGINPFYKVYLNGSVELQDIKPISLGDKLLKLIPIKNRWSSYYILTFPKQNVRVLKLTFEDKEQQKVILTFSKEI